MRTINWKIFGVLLSASVLSVVAVMPYTLTLQSEALQLSELPLPLPVVLLVSLVQSSVLLSVLIIVGLLLSKKVGLTMPWLIAWIEKEKAPNGFARMAWFAMVLGVVAAIAMLGLDWLFTALGVQIGSEAVQPPVWQGLLASLYGAIGEEIQLRLFFMSFLVWVSTKLFRKKGTIVSPITGWIAIIIAALFFGLGHLPITAQLTELTPLVVSRAFVLNGIPGVVFGWLFWKKGLESAMIAHFATDIVLHVLYPLITKI